MMEGGDVGSSAWSGRIIDTNCPQVVTVGAVGVGGEMSEESNDCDWFDRQDHPLMNNVVLGKVFKLLRGNQLKKCRLVCQTWNVATIPFMGEKCVVTVYGNLNPAVKTRRVEDFMEVFRESNLGIPFAKFNLGSFCTTDGVGQEFLQLFGNKTKDIHFLEDTFRVEDMSELLKSTPNLETFFLPNHIESTSGNIVKLFPDHGKPRLTSLKTLTVSWDNVKERRKYCPTFLEELITAAKNICRFNLSYSYPGDEVEEGDEEQFIPSSLEVMSLIEKLGREASVEEMKISPPTKSDPSDHVELLHKMAEKRNGLRLKKLDYDMDYNGRDRALILKVLPFFKDTLESLKLDGKLIPSLTEFRVMKRLTYLSLCFFEGFNSRYVNLRKLFPVLESLNLTLVMCSGLHEFFPESEPCPNIKNFHGCLFEINGFNQMLTVFPNVTDFQMRIKKDGDEILRQICTHMTQLESLNLTGTIEGEESLDCVLVGIPDNVLHDIKDVVNNLETMTEAERRETISDLRDQHCQNPSIGNLTKLKSLTLILTKLSGDGEVRKNLTHFTGYLGLHSIKTLKNLTVGNCEFKKTSCEIMTMDMGLQSWSFKTPKSKVILSGSI